ncbi:hypothetical protein AAFF_G00106810 [Aldrovandia affinis]|uniref:Uncharacterized protein n=1 Tax=Aldrovandia affinis TaxID=143900 RepID=A0AAD7WYQ8_9TELE|nr:hypothetical protein AAFF_G00106810 [Aldrovandia affinis]
MQPPARLYIEESSHSSGGSDCPNFTKCITISKVRPSRPCSPDRDPRFHGPFPHTLGPTRPVDGELLSLLLLINSPPPPAYRVTQRGNSSTVCSIDHLCPTTAGATACAFNRMGRFLFFLQAHSISPKPNSSSFQGRAGGPLSLWPRLCDAARGPHALSYLWPVYHTVTPAHWGPDPGGTRGSAPRGIPTSPHVLFFKRPPSTCGFSQRGAEETQ